MTTYIDPRDNFRFISYEERIDGMYEIITERPYDSSGGGQTVGENRVPFYRGSTGN